MFAHPGFLDLQVNGVAGVDFNDPATSREQVHEAMAALRTCGVTQALPTIISCPLDTFKRCAATVVRAGAEGVLGLHLEGPYICADDGPRGAHRREHLQPASLADFSRRQEAADGRIRLVTLAPEVPGAIRLIEHLVDAGVRVAIGHTAAGPEWLRDAVRAGASLSTHLGNGCSPMMPRHPNALWDQLADDELAASFIADGLHLPPATLKVMIRAKTPRRSILVSDAMSAAGRPPGEYRLGALSVRLDAEGRVAVPGQSNLAGSSLTLDRAVANTVRFTGLPLDEALAMASTQPAGYLGVAPLGSLELEWDPERFELRVAGVSSSA